tara:strand:+ start:239 stop:757 length:519 start_codon:yes stop_codon:yes gene_type:complete
MKMYSPIDLAFRFLKEEEEEPEEEVDDTRPGETPLQAALRRRTDKRQVGDRFNPTKKWGRIKGVKSGMKLNESTTAHLPPPPSKVEQLKDLLAGLSANQPGNVGFEPNSEEEVRRVLHERRSKQSPPELPEPEPSESEPSESEPSEPPVNMDSLKNILAGIFNPMSSKEEDE